MSRPRSRIFDAVEFGKTFRRLNQKDVHFHASFQSDFSQKCNSYSSDLEPPIRAYTHSIMHHQFTIDWSYDEFLNDKDVLNDKDRFSSLVSLNSAGICS